MRARTGLVLAGTAALAAAAVAVAYRRDLRAARAATVGRSRVVDSPWGAIEYADVGHGPALVVVHGSGGGFDQGLAIAAPLTRGPFRLISPSRFGYLRSAMPSRATPEAQADALAWLLDQLDVPQAVVLGGSAGALSATQFALRHPQLCRGLVLVVPALYAPDRKPKASPTAGRLVAAAVQRALRSDFLYWAFLRAAPDQAIQRVLATDPTLLSAASDAERRRVRDVLFNVLPVSARRKGLLMDGATAGAPPPYPVERLACPVLVIGSGDDLYGTAQAAMHTAARAPDSELILYDRGGHLWVGHDEELWAAVAAFTRDPAGYLAAEGGRKPPGAEPGRPAERLS